LQAGSYLGERLGLVSPTSGIVGRRELEDCLNGPADLRRSGRWFLIPGKSLRWCGRLLLISLVGCAWMPAGLGGSWHA
jgi:hypothetical protein